MQIVCFGFGGSPDANTNIRYGIEDVELDNMSIIEANRDRMIMPAASANQLLNAQLITEQKVSFITVLSRIASYTI